MCCRYIGSDSVKVNFQQKMGENPVEIAHKFGAQKKGLMLTAAQLETAPPPALTPIWRGRERGGIWPAYDVYPTASISPHKLLTRIPDVHVVY